MCQAHNPRMGRITERMLDATLGEGSPPEPTQAGGSDSHWATVLMNAESFEPREATEAELTLLDEMGFAVDRMWIQPGERDVA